MTTATAVDHDRAIVRRSVADVDAAVDAIHARQAELATRTRTLGADEAECRAELARRVAYGDRATGTRDAAAIQAQLLAIANERAAIVEAERLLAVDVEPLRAERAAAVRAELTVALEAQRAAAAALVAELHADVLTFARDVVQPRMAAYQAIAAEANRVKHALGARPLVVGDGALGGPMLYEDPAPDTWRLLPSFFAVARHLEAYVAATHSGEPTPAATSEASSPIGTSGRPAPTPFLAGGDSRGPRIAPTNITPVTPVR
jgi:hypothetical protein